MFLKEFKRQGLIEYQDEYLFNEMKDNGDVHIVLTIEMNKEIEQLKKEVSMLKKNRDDDIKENNEIFNKINEVVCKIIEAIGGK